jgi:pyruvate dehydrogenase (quinone)
VLALVGQQARSAMGSHYQQDLDLQSLFKDVASAYVETAITPTQMPHLIDRAYRVALAERKVTCLILPNDLQMNGLVELITIAKYWQTWSDPWLIVMFSNNRDLAFVTWEERIQAGDPKWESSQSLPDVRYADFARSIGLAGLRIESPEKIGPAWDQALSADPPMVLDFVTDPDVPPLPPHISLKQVRNFMKAMLSGDPAAGSAIASTARELVGAILPGKRDT